jgi:hypothetical protein
MNEGQPNANENTRKMTARAQTIGGLSLVMTAVQADILSKLSDSQSDVQLGLVLADGTAIQGTGYINCEEWQSDSASMVVAMTPRKNGWKVFAL